MIFKYTLASFAILLAALGPSVAHAASCNSSGGNYSIDIGEKIISPDAAVGAVLPMRVTQSAGYRLSCVPDYEHDRDVFVSFRVAAPPVPGFFDVYPTNLAGVGVRYLFSGNMPGSTSCDMQPQQRIEDSLLVVTCHLVEGTAVVGAANWISSVVFVKTGPIASGQLTTIPAVTMFYNLNDQSGSWGLNRLYLPAAMGNLTVQAERAR